MLLLLTQLFAITKLGATYVVVRDNSPYVAEEGDRNIRSLPKSTQVRLIKNETLVETGVLFPIESKICSVNQL